GNVSSKDGDIDVKGRVTGDITARSVDVHMGGQVSGTIAAGDVRIQGNHTGRIDCTELSLEKSAEVKADVKAQTLSSEKGSRLVGKIQITGA
ncbi:MAG: polymer-forming cytoskeletal protein, partial [Albidovulum sp.]